MKFIEIKTYKNDLVLINIDMIVSMSIRKDYNDNEICKLVMINGDIFEIENPDYLKVLQVLRSDIYRRVWAKKKKEYDDLYERLFNKSEQTVEINENK